MSRYFYFVFLLIILLPGYAISETWQWAKAIPGASLSSIEPTLDGGYVAVGSKDSNDGTTKALLVRFDSSGNIQWAKTYGSSTSDVALMVYQAEDGGFVFTGNTDSNGGDAFFMKVDAVGNILWQKAYGTPSYEEASVILRTSDGGFFVLGNGSGIWSMKLNPKREICWVRIYGQPGTTVSAAAPTSDGGLILTGYRSGTIVVKLDPNGNIMWQKQYGEGFSEPTSIATTADGGYAVGGTMHVPMWGRQVGWVAKLDSEGNLSWRKAFGGFGYGSSGVNAVRQENDGHILVMGSLGVGQQQIQIWSTRFTSQGRVVSQQAFGQTQTRVKYAVSAIHGTPDDGTVIVGSREQRDFNTDSLVARTSFAGDICTAFQKTTSIRTYDLDWKVQSIHVGNRKGMFDVRTPHYIQTPVPAKMIDLCK